MKRLWPITVLLFFVACAVHFRLHHKYDLERTSMSQMLYLPSGKYLKPVSFGYHTLLADYVFLWSIQYYTDPGFHPRTEYLKHTYDIISELDPHYLDAYRTGAFLLFYDAYNPEAGLNLLDQGFERNPTEWILPTDAGFYCMMTIKDKKRAAVYFEKASRVPGSPTMLKRLQANALFKLGDKQTAFKLWQEVFESAEDTSIRETATQHLHDLKVLIDIEYISAGIVRFFTKNDRYPLNLNQLVSNGMLEWVPLDPEGNDYVYYPRSGKVQYSRKLTLYRRYQ